MKAIDRRAAEFRALQEGIQARLQGLDLSALGDLTLALTIQEFRSLEFLASVELRKTKELAEYLGLAVNSVTDVVDALEKKGLARRRKELPRPEAFSVLRPVDPGAGRGLGCRGERSVTSRPQWPAPRARRQEYRHISDSGFRGFCLAASGGP